MFFSLSSPAGWADRPLLDDVYSKEGEKADQRGNLWPGYTQRARARAFACRSVCVCLYLICMCVCVVWTILNPRHIYHRNKKKRLISLFAVVSSGPFFFSSLLSAAIGHRRHRLSAKVATLRFKLWTPRNLKFIFSFFLCFFCKDFAVIPLLAFCFNIISASNWSFPCLVGRSCHAEAEQAQTRRH